MDYRVTKTLKDIVQLSSSYVSKRPRHEVEEWIATCLGIKRLDLYLQFDRPMQEDELDRIRSGIAQLAQGVPLAYIVGHAPFYNDEFIVDKNILIPRPETEILVDIAAEFMRDRSGTLVDVCTGSGCVGLTLKKLFPTWHVILIDICDRALCIAEQNTKKLNLDVEIRQGDLLEPVSEQVEAIVCNPPYLSHAEWHDLDPTVKNYEPRLALDAGIEGTEIYKRLFSQVRSVLTSPGFVAVEIGAGQGEKVGTIAQSYGYEYDVHKDLANRDRVLCLL